MKKFLALALILAMVFALAACGGEKDPAPSGNTADPGTSQQPTDEPDGGEEADLTTVTGFLTAFGLTEDGLINCPNFSRLDKTTYSIDTGEIKEVGVYISEALTDEEVRAWLEQMLDKLKSLSDDGKVINNFSDTEGEELTVDYIMERSMKLGLGTYTYKGKTVTVMITASPRSLDNADPDEAMPALSLKLEWL